MTDEPLRIGILGAARIAELSIVRPAAATGHRLVAVAARDPRRAAAFAERYGVERVHASYEDLLDDPGIEAVYNPLANGLHAPWNLRILAAGKHLLTEKPSAGNAEEATRVRDAAETADRVFMEAFHYPYHPLFQRVRSLLDDGAIGKVQHVEAFLGMPAPEPSDPRWSLDLAGGSTMDLGCYSLSAVTLLGHHLGGPPRIVSGRAGERAGSPGVDERLSVDVEFPDGTTGTAGSDMAATGWDFHLTVTGTDGQMHVPDFPRPHEDDSLVLRRHGRTHVERLGSRSSYTYQLEAFAAAIRHGSPVVTDTNLAVMVMELIDAAYAAAGLPRRESLRDEVTRPSP